MRIAFADRRGDVLSGHGTLPCMHDVPCINVTRGCSYECSYCTSRVHRPSHDGPHVVVYTNLAEKLREELAQVKHRPRAVYFSPACDAFQSVRQVLAVSYESMKVLLEHHVGVTFSTVGAIPSAFMSLFADHPQYVQAQVNLSTSVRAIQKVIEHHAAPPAKRIENIRRLQEIGVEVEVRVDPLIPALTDIEVNLAKLFTDLEPLVPLRASVSYMFLRGHVEENLRMAFGTGSAFRRIMKLYQGGYQVHIDRGTSDVQVLAPGYRREKYEEIEQMAKEHGIATYVCACKNPDLSQRMVCRANRESHFSEAVGQNLLFAV